MVRLRVAWKPITSGPTLADLTLPKVSVHNYMEFVVGPRPEQAQSTGLSTRLITERKPPY